MGQIVPKNYAEESDCDLERDDPYYFKDKDLEDRMEVENLIDEFLEKKDIENKIAQPVPKKQQPSQMKVKF